MQRWWLAVTTLALVQCCSSERAPQRICEWNELRHLIYRACGSMHHKQDLNLDQIEQWFPIWQPLKPFLTLPPHNTYPWEPRILLHKCCVDGCTESDFSGIC